MDAKDEVLHVMKKRKDMKAKVLGVNSKLTVLIRG